MARMKREDAMQGSWFEAVDERGRSLVMDDGVGVSAPAWWRRTAVDGVADGGDCGGEGVLVPTEYEWGNGGREEGGNHVFRARLSQMRGNLQTSPPFKISYITTILVGWG